MKLSLNDLRVSRIFIPFNENSDCRLWNIHLFPVRVAFLVSHYQKKEKKGRKLSNTMWLFKCFWITSLLVCCVCVCVCILWPKNVCLIMNELNFVLLNKEIKEKNQIHNPRYQIIWAIFHFFLFSEFNYFK